MKVVQALHNPADDAARAVQARKRTGVPAEQDDIRRIRTLHAIQIPWIRDNDAVWRLVSAQSCIALVIVQVVCGITANSMAPRKSNGGNITRTANDTGAFIIETDSHRGLHLGCCSLGLESET